MQTQTNSVPTMHIAGPDQQPIQDEIEVLKSLLNFTGARVLELGCGAADKTRQIAEQTSVAHIVAAEVDHIQHAKNLAITDLPNVTFASFGAEDIDAPDNSFDIVLMFKSLHHVPGELMDQGLQEIRRVLKPGGKAYISEPVFAGEFNEVIRLFHDESEVRKAAFDAVQKAVNNNVLALEREYFFKNIVRLAHFGQFEKGILQATFMDHDLSDDLYNAVKEKFESYAANEGYVFEVPNRVDLLTKV
jgi:ubiquinone/menaquinone biosynthesis C-methylase UbiE